MPIRGYRVPDIVDEDNGELEIELNSHLIGRKVLIEGVIIAVGVDIPGGIEVEIAFDYNAQGELTKLPLVVLAAQDNVNLVGDEE